LEDGEGEAERSRSAFVGCKFRRGGCACSIGGAWGEESFGDRGAPPPLPPCMEEGMTTGEWERGLRVERVAEGACSPRGPCRECAGALDPVLRLTLESAMPEDG